MTQIAKAISPEQAGWRARLAAGEPPLVAAFLAWVASLQQAIQDEQIVHAIVAHATGAFDHVLQAIAFRPDIAAVAEREAIHSFDELARRLTHQVRLSFDLHDPNFDLSVQRHGAQLIREVTDETRRAVANMIERGYQNGWPADRLAPVIRSTVGLTARQANAVITYSDSLTRKGLDPNTVAARSMRYAGQLRNRRALTIARTETARAAVTGRLASYEQAAARGLFDRATAELEWSAVQQDPAEICGQLDGQRVPFGQSFDGLLPPAHPCCRCSVHLVLDR